MIKRTGLVLIELLIVLSIVSILGLWRLHHWTASLEADARLLAGVVSLARASAAVDGKVATVFGVTCSPRPIVVLEGFTNARLVGPARGLLFTPDGLPRTCDGGGVGNTTILLEHRGRQAAGIVSSLGRVRWEMR